MLDAMRDEIPEVINNDSDLLLLWGLLLSAHPSDVRTLYLSFLHPDGFAEKVVVPIDGIPQVPAREEVDGFRQMLGHFNDGPDGLCPIFALARPGFDDLHVNDVKWLRILHSLSDDFGRRWPVVLRTRSGVRILDPSELEVGAMPTGH